MVTDTDKMEAVIDDAYILITDKKISNIQEILPLLEQVLQAGKKLVIIAEDIEGEVLPQSLSSSVAPSPIALRLPASATEERKCSVTSLSLRAARVITEELA